MKLTILGSGTVVPSATRNSAGYFVEAPGVKLMMDCGAGTVHALARYGLGWEEMTHIFISHFHVDHIGELASLFFAFKWGTGKERSERLTVIGPRGLDGVLRNWDRALGPRLFEPKFPVELKMIEPGDQLELSSETRLTAHKTPHTTESLAVRIESGSSSICYTGDTGYSDDLADFFAAADVLISECSFQNKRDGVPHLSVEEVGRMAARARVRRLVVTHFYFPVEEAELVADINRAFSGEVLIGRDGLSLEA